MEILCLQKSEATFWGENLLSVYITYPSIQVFSVIYLLIFGKSLIAEN